MEAKISDNRMVGLKSYVEQRSKEILLKVTNAIEKLTSNDIPITFEAVAKAAGVSRGTLYNNTQIKEQILKLRIRGKSDSLDAADSIRKTKVQLQKEQILALRKRVNQLEKDKKNLIVQLVDLEAIKEENVHLKNVLRGKQL